METVFESLPKKNLITITLRLIAFYLYTFYFILNEPLHTLFIIYYSETTPFLFNFIHFVPNPLLLQIALFHFHYTDFDPNTPHSAPTPLWGQNIPSQALPQASTTLKPPAATKNDECVTSIYIHKLLTQFNMSRKTSFYCYTSTTGSPRKSIG